MVISCLKTGRILWKFKLRAGQLLFFLAATATSTATATATLVKEIEEAVSSQSVSQLVIYCVVSPGQAHWILKVYSTIPTPDSTTSSG